MSLKAKLLGLKQTLSEEDFQNALRAEVTNHNINVMVHSQILIDEIEELEDIGILRHKIKFKAKAFKEELLKHNLGIFKPLNDEQQRDVSYLYETNFNWLKEFTSLSTDERLTVMEMIKAVKAGEVKKVNEYQFNKIREPKKK